MTYTLNDVHIDKEKFTVEDAIEAAEQIFSLKEDEFQRIKNEKWYHHLLQAVTFGSGDRKKIISDITSLSKLLQIFMLIYAKSYKEQDPKYMMPKEVEIFLNLQKELQISSVEEARNLIKSTRQERIGINKRKKEILDLQRELNHLDTIKEEKLIQSGLYIHNIKFGGNHIDYKKSNNDNYCIILPYTKEKMYIPKKYTAFNEKYQYYTLFLVLMIVNTHSRFMYFDITVDISLLI